MMLFDGVLETRDYPLLKAIIFSFNLQWPAAGVPRAERASRVKKEKKKLSKSRELRWTPLEKIYFRIKHLMLGFHFLTAMGCGNKCQSRRRRAATLANNRKLFVASQSGIWAQRAALKMWLDNGCETHPSNGAVTQTPHRSLRCGFAESPPLPGCGLCCSGPGWKGILLASLVTLGDIMLRCQEDPLLSFEVWTKIYAAGSHECANRTQDFLLLSETAARWKAYDQESISTASS